MGTKAKQAIAISMLVEGALHKDVAEKVGVTPQTISTWLKDPTFVATVNTLKIDNLNSAMDKMQALFSQAAATVEDIMVNGDNDAVRLKAAQCAIQTSGVLDLQSGLWAFNIGPKTAAGVEREWNRADLRIGGHGLDIDIEQFLKTQ